MLGASAGARRAGRAKKAAAVEEQMLGRGVAFGHFPAAAANDVHGLIPPDIGACKEYGAAAFTGKSRIAGASASVARLRAATPLRRLRRDDLVGGACRSVRPYGRT